MKELRKGISANEIVQYKLDWQSKTPLVRLYIKQISSSDLLGCSLIYLK